MNPSPILLSASRALRTQDNRITQNPMFCLQILVREVGFDTSLFDTRCWHSFEDMETVYDDDPDYSSSRVESEGWEEFSYKDRWETVMVAFTEQALNEYMELDGHNVRRRAFRGKVQVYVESFNRCPEMIAIREAVMDLTREGADHA